MEEPWLRLPSAGKPLASLGIEHSFEGRAPPPPLAPFQKARPRTPPPWPVLLVFQPDESVSTLSPASRQWLRGSHRKVSGTGFLLWFMRLTPAPPDFPAPLPPLGRRFFEPC